MMCVCGWVDEAGDQLTVPYTSMLCYVLCFALLWVVQLDVAAIYLIDWTTQRPQPTLTKLALDAVYISICTQQQQRIT